MLNINKDENVHKYAVRGGKLKYWRERERDRERGRKREREREKEG